MDTEDIDYTLEEDGATVQPEPFGGPVVEEKQNTVKADPDQYGGF